MALANPSLYGLSHRDSFSRFADLVGHESRWKAGDPFFPLLLLSLLLLSSLLSSHPFSTHSPTWLSRTLRRSRSSEDGQTSTGRRQTISSLLQLPLLCHRADCNCQCTVLTDAFI